MKQHQMLHNTANATRQQVAAVKEEENDDIRPNGHGVPVVAQTVSSNLPNIKSELEYDTNYEQSFLDGDSTEGTSNIPTPCIKQESDECKCDECIGKKLVKDEPADEGEEIVKQETEEMRPEGQTDAANVPQNLALIKSEPDSDQDISEDQAGTSTDESSTPVPISSDTKHEFDCDCSECKGEELVKIESGNETEETNESEDDAQMESDTESLDQPEEGREDIGETNTSSEHDRHDVIDAAVNDQPEHEEHIGPSQEFTVRRSSRSAAKRQIHYRPVDLTSESDDDETSFSSRKKPSTSSLFAQTSRQVSNNTDVPSTSGTATFQLASTSTQQPYQEMSSGKRKIDQQVSSKPYKCTVCNKAFTQSGHLTVHQRSHTGERPYQCSQCNKAFYTSSKLKRHERTHSGEKTHQCTVCDKAFTQSGHLTIHQRSHTGERPYKCSQCNKAFKSSCKLKLHQRTHSGEKTHQCTVCDKAFSQSGHLTIHQRSHTGERPYKCSQCNKAFKSSCKLKRHQRTHSGE